MNREFHIEKRKKFAEQMDDFSVAVIYSKEPPKASLDENFEFCVDRNFYYLTGINRENMVLVIRKALGQVVEQIYTPKIDPFMEKWYGIMMTDEEVYETSGIANILDVADVEQDLANMFGSMNLMENLYIITDLANINAEMDEYKRLASKIRIQFPCVNIKNAYGIMMKLRSVKEDCEIDQIKNSIKITKEALEFLMSKMHAGMYEYEVRAHFEYQLMLHNSSPSFPTIAAGGERGVILHYTDLVEKINDNEMVMVDLGALSKLYCSDISRTYPVNGKFTDRQKMVYNIVLEAQQVAAEHMKVGASERDCNNAVIKFYADALKKIKLIKDDNEVGKYYYHSIGHPLGLDCHDLGTRDRVYQDNSVFTIEPGLYIKEWGIGIRIEDDVLVNKKGITWLSKDIIKSVEDIENFMK